MPRSQIDASLRTNVTMGNVGFTVSTNALDLGQTNAFPVSERILAQINTSAGTNAANNKNVNITIQHSNVNTAANFTNIAELAPFIIPEVAAGYAASTCNHALPPGTKQFIRLLVKGEANGGNSNDAVASLQLLF